jgi:hypothetical protein
MTAPPAAPTPGSTPARTLRRGLLGLALLSVLAIGYELFAERHWGTNVQLVAWALLLVLVLALVLACSARRPAVVAARLSAVVVLVGAGFGIYQHVASNYIAGQLDTAYSDSWETRTESDKVLLAVTKTVGINPPLAPGALGQAALLVLLATVGRGRPRPSDR